MCGITKPSEGPSTPAPSGGAPATGAPSASPPELIRSRRNPLVGRLRELHDGAGRRRQELLLLEGTHLLQETLALGLVPDLVLATPAWLEDHSDLVAALPAATVVRRGSEEVLAAAATTRHPDGVLHTLRPPAPRPAPPGGPGFVLALDRLQDPGNLGTLLRTALAAGVERVWLADGADPHQPKVLRASSGAALALPLERLPAAELERRVEEARRSGLEVVATTVRGGMPYWRHDWRRPTLLLLGNEGAGLAPGLAERADALVTIPHSPAVESLNVAVAAAPLLLERWRQTLGGGTSGIRGERMPPPPRSRPR